MTEKHYNPHRSTTFANRLDIVMTQGTQRLINPVTQGPIHIADDIGDSRDTWAHDLLADPAEDLEDDFEEFGLYGKMAAAARVKGASKPIEITRMRDSRDAKAGRKLNKPLHKDKRGL